MAAGRGSHLERARNPQFQRSDLVEPAESHIPEILNSYYIAFKVPGPCVMLVITFSVRSWEKEQTMKRKSQPRARVSIGPAAVLTKPSPPGIIICASLVLLLGSPGCGTIIHGKWQTAQFTSEPPGAEVHYRDQLRGTTPCSVEIRRHLVGQTVRLKMAGMDDQEVRTKNGVSLWFIGGNVIFGGVIGIVVDLISGSSGALWKDDYHVTFATPADTPQVVQQTQSAPPPFSQAKETEPRAPSFYKGMSPAQIRDRLGSPDSISHGARSEIWYFGDSYFGFDDADRLVLWSYK